MTPESIATHRSSPRGRCDTRLYALVDPDVSGGRDIAQLARAAAEGGATLIQLRDKSANRREITARANAVRAALEGTGVPFLINDAVDVALAVGADGVHLGQEDLHPADARRLLGDDAIIGLTIKSRAHVDAAPLEIVDYLAVGGVFTTSSKVNPDPPIGVDGLADLVARIRGRGFAGEVCAIAGITPERIDDVIGAGADGICAVSAISAADAPQQAAARLREAVDAALAVRAGTS